jgi:GT2 family glycosyltransferase
VSDLRTAPARGGSNSSRVEPEAVAEAQAVDAPPVVAVVVASNPGPQFAEMLASLADQDYENLSVLVIDAGSDEPIADRVADVLPEAYLHRLAGDPGWSVAANQSIELVSGSPFLLFCHDDVALAPQCVSTLMGELYRSNAGIAGPKMVRWDDSRKLLQIGMGSDRFGVMVDQVERGEFDQQQYDSVRDVFVAPGGVQLIRADLFVALGGFDPAIGVMGEDLDLCWRAHALGARVLAVSGAMVRHRESMDDRLTIRQRRKLAARHRLRTVMVTASSRRSRLTTVPLAVVLIALEGLYYLLSGRRGQARDMYSAIVWNLAHLPDISRRRRNLRQIRQRSDREVRALQIGGSATVSSFSRGQFTAGQDRFSGFLGAIRSSFQGEDSGSLRDATVIGFGIALVLLFGSRHLLTRGVVPVGQIPVVPSASALFREWFGGWRSAGTGGPGNPPTALVFLAAARALLFWAPGVFDNLLVLGPFAIGVTGAFRLARPLGSARSGAVAAAFYGATPLVTASVASGRWDSLVVYGAAPYLLASLLRIDGVSPYGSRNGPAGLKVVPRSFPVLIIRYGFLVAFVAAFVPAVVVVGVLLALAFVAAALVTGQGLAPRDFLLAVAAAVVAPVALHFPWSYDLARQISWRWLIGPPSPEAVPPTFVRLLTFAPGRFGPSVFAIGLVVAAMIGLLVATRNLWRVAVQSTRCWHQLWPASACRPPLASGPSKPDPAASSGGG